MLYYITPMQVKLYTSSRKQKSWFAASIENEGDARYGVRNLKTNDHGWDVGTGALCRCCDEAKWDFQVDWDEAR